MKQIKTLVLATALGLWASAATAHHIAGSVVCTDTSPPTPLAGVEVRVDGALSDGFTYTQPDGTFYINVAPISDTYTVTIVTPAGMTLTSPASGQYVAQIFAGGVGGPDSFEGANFQLTGCATPPSTLVIRVACPNDSTSSGIGVCVAGVGCVFTDSLGLAQIQLPGPGTYNVCVDTTTLPPGATLSTACQNIQVVNAAPPVVGFVLGGDFCSPPPPQGECWLTGGGTIGRSTKGVPNFSFGGVVYPGCSPKAADGGNWNVVNHFDGLHFQGQHIIVDSCSGVPTKSPKVNVNIIDFHGTGIIAGIGGNPDATIPVTFVGRAIDNQEGGGGSDKLYLSVSDGSTIVLQIGNSTANPATIATGNLQIHTTSCGK